jgi:hypothetical protein
MNKKFEKTQRQLNEIKDVNKLWKKTKEIISKGHEWNKGGRTWYERGS